MNKSIVKKALLVGAVGGLVVLGFQAQKYVRLFLAMRKDEPLSEEESAERDQQLDELLKTGDAVKVRISSVSEDEDSDEDDT